MTISIFSFLFVIVLEVSPFLFLFLLLFLFPFPSLSLYLFLLLFLFLCIFRFLLLRGAAWSLPSSGGVAFLLPFAWCCLVSSLFGWSLLFGAAFLLLLWVGLLYLPSSVGWCCLVSSFLLGGVVVLSFSCLVVLPSIPSFGWGCFFSCLAIFIIFTIGTTTHAHTRPNLQIQKFKNLKNQKMSKNDKKETTNVQKIQKSKKIVLSFLFFELSFPFQSFFSFFDRFSICHPCSFVF